MELTRKDREFIAAVERGTRGLEFVSAGACLGCEECGLAPTECRECWGEGLVWDDMGHVAWDCPECGGEGEIAATERDRECADEGGFSWVACDCCGNRLGGNRYPAHGRDAGGRMVHLDICQDCVQYIANGELPPE